MQTLPIPLEPDPKPHRIHPIITSTLPLHPSRPPHPSKNPQFKGRNAQDFHFWAPTDPKAPKDPESPSSINSRQFQKSCSRLEKQELVKHLKLYFSDPQSMEESLHAFTHSFRRPHLLTGLRLGFETNFKLTPPLIKKLSNVFLSMQHLTNLSVSYFTQSTGNLLCPFLASIQKLRSLSHLDLWFHKAFMDDHQVQILCSGLSIFKSLTHLSLHFLACPNLTNEGIRRLFIMGRSLKLNSFDIALSGSPDPVNETIVYLDIGVIMRGSEQSLLNYNVKCEYVELRQGTTFDFSLKDNDEKISKFSIRYHETQDQEIQEKYNLRRDLVLAWPNRQNLKSLTLECSGYYGTNTLAPNLALCINQMKSLENLVLLFEASQYLSSLSGVIKSLKNLKNIPCLKALKLKFIQFSLNETEIKGLVGDCLGKISKLKTLELDLGHCGLSYEIFQSLSLLNLSELESLCLFIGPVIENFGERLLDAVKRVFSKEKKLEIEKFFASLESFQKLKSLVIKLDSLTFSLQDQKALSKSLGNMKYLKKMLVEASYDEILHKNPRGFEDLLIESQACWLTLHVLIHNFWRQSNTYVMFYFEDHKGLPYQLTIGFSDWESPDWYQENPEYFKKLMDFFKGMNPKFIEQNLESYEGLMEAIEDHKQMEFFDVTGPVSQSLVFKAFIQRFLVYDLRLCQYSWRVSSSKPTYRMIKKCK